MIAALPAFGAAEPAPSLQAGPGVDVRWTVVFPGPGDGWINDIVALAPDGFLAVGFLGRDDALESPDWHALAAELDGAGKVRWRSELGDGGGVDAFWNAAQTANGQITYGGFTTRIGAGGIDAWVVVTDSGGRMLHESTIGESDYDRFTDLVATRDGKWLLVGHSVAPGTKNRRVLIAKVDEKGKELWRRIFEEGTAALYVEQAPGGGYIVAGGTNGAKDDADLLIQRVDDDGRETWRRAVGVPDRDEVNHGVVVRPDGRIVALGYTAKAGAEEHDLLAVTLSPGGETLEESVFGGAQDDRAIGARLDASGRIWVIGYTKSTGRSDWDVILAAVDEKGRFEPGVTIVSGPADDNGAAVLPLENGDLLLGGYSASVGDGGSDAFVMRVSAPDPRREDARFRLR
jgi:hypothetical protein